jgi:hypothetical protein
MSSEISRAPDGRMLSPTLVGFMQSWQQRQRKTAGMQAVLFNRIDSLGRSHPEWREYDLLTHTLAALHLVIENDRLTGGHTREQTVQELVTLVAIEVPGDEREQHVAIAEAVVDLLMNTRERQARLVDRYMRLGEHGLVDHPDQSFRLVRTAGLDDAGEPMLRADPEAINIFQNLFSFDPADRSAAERYRSERMLHRQDYDEVLYSVARRATSIQGLEADLAQLLRKIRSNVADVDYAVEVIPKLDESIALVREQIDAEERFAEAVAEHSHHRAPDLARLQNITEHLQALIQSLTALHRSASTVKAEFEDQQDRQLFTYRRVSINPQSDLFEPLLAATPAVLCDLLSGLLPTFLGPVKPKVANLQTLIDRTAPAPRRKTGTTDEDPFDFGTVREQDGDVDGEVLAATARVLAGITAPTSLSQLIACPEDFGGDVALTEAQAALLPWMLAVVVASAYGSTDSVERSEREALFDHARYGVVKTGRTMDLGAVRGDDLVIVPIAPGPDFKEA